MESREAGLNDFGARIDAELADATRPVEQIRDAREGLLERLTLGTAAGRGSLRAFFGAPRTLRALAVAGAAAAVAAGIFVYHRVPISFEVGGTGVPAGVGAAIAAERTESVPLTFSEGSSVVVRPGGRVRVLGTEPTGAHVLLENGGIDVAITHRERKGTAWTFDAGPLSVAVTGTKFHLAWSPQNQVFTLGVSEGAVLVSGSCLATTRSVKAHERIELACRAEESARPEAPATATAAEPNAAAEAVPSAHPPTPSAAPVERGWRELLRSGKLSEGLAAAVNADFKTVCQSATQAELLALSDAARITGDLDKAKFALVTLRQRFPGSSNAAAAAFSLGRIAFERRAAYTEAVRWFSTYLDEAPNGPLMGDAVGRLMEARHRQGDSAGARADAERYLQRFPKGPYASVANRLLTEP